MGLSVVNAPALEPVSLDEAKQQCRVDSTDEDGLISGYVLAAREFVENSTHTKLVTQTMDYTIDDCWPCVHVRGYYRARIELPLKPIASITSITYVDTNGATQTLAADQYVLRNDGPVHYIDPAYGVIWPSIRCQSAAVTVRMVVGTELSSVPNQLLQAIRWLIAHQYRQREAVSTANLSEIPLALESFMSAHRFTRF